MGMTQNFSKLEKGQLVRLSKQASFHGYAQIGLGTIGMIAKVGTPEDLQKAGLFSPGYADSDWYLVLFPDTIDWFLCSWLEPVKKTRKKLSGDAI